MADIVDPLTGLPRNPLAFMREREILAGRRAFPVTQQLFSGAPLGVSRALNVGWHDTSMHPETGAFGLVRRDGVFDDLIGEIVKVTTGEKQAYVYVIQSADVPADLSLARRAFAALSLLSMESLACQVVAVQ